MNNESAYGENDTLLYDFSNHINATAYGSPEFNSTGGFLGDGCFNITPASATGFQAVEAMASINNTPSFTLSFWYYRNNYTGAYPISTGDNSFRIYESSNKGLYYYGPVSFIADGTLLVSGTLDQDWNYIVISANGSTVRTFLNGKLNQTITQAGNLSLATNNLYLGSIKPTSTGMNGSLDEVIVWNRSLSNSEVHQLYGRYNYAINCSYVYLGMQLDSSTTLCNGTYNLNSSYSKSAIYIVSDNVSVDLNESIIYGNLTDECDGIYTNKLNAIIQNGNMYNYDVIIGTSSANGLRIANMTFGNMSEYALRPYRTNDSVIENSNFTTNSSSGFIYLQECFNVTVQNNNMTSLISPYSSEQLH